MKISSNGGVPGRRERNKQRIREQIYRAAVELFAENGYEATTVDEIAERADIARGTFFNHFPHKEDLITEWADTRRRTMLARLELPLSIETNDVNALLQLCLSTLAQVNEEERPLTGTMLTAWVKAGKPLTEAPYTAEVFADIIQGGLDRGEIDTRVQPRLLAEVLRDAYLGALYRWTRENSAPGILGQDLRAILSIFMRGAFPHTSTSEESDRNQPPATTGKTERGPARTS